MRVPIWMGWIAAVALGAVDEHYAYQRWAIVPAEALQHDGLGDLVNVEVSRLDHITLVERDQLAVKIAQLIEQTRRHFTGGVREIIGVPHFVSRNLTHEYDNLQTGYARLVESSLACVRVADRIPFQTATSNSIQSNRENAWR